MFGNHCFHCALLSDDPWRDSSGSHQGRRLVGCAHHVGNPWFKIVYCCFVVLWHTGLLLVRCGFGFLVSVVPSSGSLSGSWGSSSATSSTFGACASNGLNGYFGNVNSCLWLVKVAHAHSTRWSNSTWTACFEGDEFPEVCAFTFW